MDVDARGTLLLIEDDDADALVSETIFAQNLPEMIFKRLKNYSTAEAFFARLKRNLDTPAPACVLLDLRLGDGDGEALLDLMVDHPRLKNTVVIVLSGDSSNPRRDLDRPGVACRMEKPDTLGAYKRLLETISTLMHATQTSNADISGRSGGKTERHQPAA